MLQMLKKKCPCQLGCISRLGSIINGNLLAPLVIMIGLYRLRGPGQVSFSSESPIKSVLMNIICITACISVVNINTTPKREKNDERGWAENKIREFLNFIILPEGIFVKDDSPVSLGKSVYKPWREQSQNFLPWRNLEIQ